MKSLLSPSNKKRRRKDKDEGEENKKTSQPSQDEGEENKTTSQQDNASQVNKTLSSDEAKQLAQTLKVMDRTMTGAFDIYGWAMYNADPEFYSQMYEFDTWLRRLQETLSIVPSKTPANDTYLVGLWLDSDACGLAKLSNLAMTLHGIVSGLQAKTSQITEEAAKTWFWSSTSNSLGQEELQMVVNANRLLQEGVVSCAPRTFSRSGKSLSESLSNKEMFAAYGIYVLQRRTEIALVVVFIVVAIVVITIHHWVLFSEGVFLEVAFIVIVIVSEAHPAFSGADKSFFVVIAIIIITIHHWVL